MHKFDYRRLEEETWDSEILKYISQISEFKGRQEIILSQKPNILQNIMENVKIKSTQYSNEMDGIRLSEARIKDLYNKRVEAKNEEEKEVLAYLEILSTIKESYEDIPINSDTILKLHKDLYKYSDKSSAGKFKDRQNYVIERNVKGEEFVTFTPLNPVETPNAIEKICQEYNKAIEKEEVNPLIFLSVFIHDFLCIYPFNEGNGRIFRLLTTLLLYKLGYFVGRYVSLDEKMKISESYYYSSLEKSGLNWHENKEDKSFFIKYILVIVLISYKDFWDMVYIFDSNLSALDQVKNSIDKKTGKFTKNDILKDTPTISKASVENSLKELVDNGYIERRGKGRATFYLKN